MLGNAQRYDMLDAASSPERMPNGYLRVGGVFTRTGVFTYRMPDGSQIRELRHPADVLDSASISTLTGVPFTNDHIAGGVTPKNARRSAVGSVLSASATSDHSPHAHVEGVVCVWDEASMTAIQNGKQALSCGYRADIVDESGMYEGEEYDRRQTNIRYNHLALVDVGRAGDVARLRMDGDCVLIEDAPPEEPNKRSDMEPEETTETAEAPRADEGKDYEKLYEDMKSKYDQMKEKHDALKGKLDAMDKPSDDEKPKEKEKADGLSVAELNAYAAERAQILRVLSRERHDTAEASKLSNTELRREFVAAERGDADGLTDAYISAYFDICAARADAAEPVATAKSKPVAYKSEPKEDTAADPVHDAIMARNQGAHTGKSPEGVK